MIEDVEELGSELDVCLFTNVGILHHREIEVMESRPGYDVASRVAEGQWLIGREGCRIEPAIHGMRTGVGIANQVGTIIAQSCAAIVLPGQNRERLSGL